MAAQPVTAQREEGVAVMGGAASSKKLCNSVLPSEPVNNRKGQC